MDNLFPIPLNDMARLKGMFRAEANSYLTATYPHLDEADVDALLRLTIPDGFASDPTEVHFPTGGTTPKKSYVVDPTRSHFILGATLAGASQYQLASIFAISRQTVYSVLRRVNRPEYDILRKHGAKYSDAEAREMHDWYSRNRTIASELPLLQLVAKLESVALDARTRDPGE